MLQFFHRCYLTRWFWLFLTFTALIYELVAFYLQYLMLFNPCVLCIYQRCAIYGIIFSGLLGSISPNTLLLRVISFLIWIYSALQGLIFAIKHFKIKFYPSPFTTCDFVVQFPQWLPLDKWLPLIFRAIGDCTVSQLHFLSLEISQWMIIIFIIYLSIGISALIAQCIFLFKKFFLHRR